MNQVLVVDDEAPMRAALEAHFVRDGWKVTTAYGAHDALAKFRIAPCPLVVTDTKSAEGRDPGVAKAMQKQTSTFSA